MCVCVYVYVYIHILTHTYIHTHNNQTKASVSINADVYNSTNSSCIHIAGSYISIACRVASVMPINIALDMKGENNPH